MFSKIDKNNGFDILIKNKFGVSAKNILPTGHNFLTFAIEFSDTTKNIDKFDICKQVINAGFNINLPDSSGITPLIGSIIAKEKAITKLLLENVKDTSVLDYNDKSGRSALLLSIINGDTSNVRILLDKGADPNKHGKKVSSPLAAAIIMHADDNEELSFNLVKLLYENGAKINAKSILSELESFPMHDAIRSKKILKYLVDNGADINVINSNGAPVIGVAAANGKIEIVKILIDAGADLEIKTSNGMNTLWAAMTNEQYSVVEEILKAGANPNSKLKYQRYVFTPMDYAVASSDYKLQKIVKKYKGTAHLDFLVAKQHGLINNMVITTLNTTATINMTKRYFIKNTTT